MRVNELLKNSVFLLVLALIIFLPSVYAQYEDNDADGVVNTYDACPETNHEEGLPIITQNKEFLGCSCSQIYETTGEYCYDVFCSTGRPFMIKERTYSSRTTECSPDYCINNTLYNFPDNKILSCSNGKEESFSCNATIIENADVCRNGSVSQFIPVPDVIFEEEIILLDDYEKLQNRAYNLSQSNELKTSLGISGEQTFVEQTEKTMDSIVIEKTLNIEKKNVSGTEKTISIKKITITPSRHRTLTDVYVFEELPHGSKVIFNEIITGTDVIYQDENLPVLLVWKIDRVKKPVELTYQVNKAFDGDSNTLVVAKEINNGFWKYMILPTIFIIIVVWVFIKTSEKSIPKRKKIFKE